MTTTWVVDEAEGVASGDLVPVTAEGQLITVLQALWSDIDGVRVQWDVEVLPDDLSAAQTLALADALRQVGAVEPPTGLSGRSA
ncbi:hypothetical protein [Microbacterium rhizosphaerae]|uniref:Uncharacterized protein n=1 Tax=Microbacterium rhizosphaerae TaxID=1678237 RepID=A0ABZ0SKP3_9MICO|nr:hypothetical protein [Microbacterium rhizosphaerae]WPR88398.1 hypothetical protein SM116_11475 [Microbacterium rhizosphaerae]